MPIGLPPTAYYWRGFWKQESLQKELDFIRLFPLKVWISIHNVPLNKLFKTRNPIPNYFGLL